MSFVVAAPEVMAAAAARLEHIGSALNAAGGTAAGSITGVAAAGADEVSIAIASVFSGYAETYQQLSAQLAAFHAQFVANAQRAAAAYYAADAQFRTLLADRQAGRRLLPNPAPDLNETSPAGGG